MLFTGFKIFEERKYFISLGGPTVYFRVPKPPPRRADINLMCMCIFYEVRQHFINFSKVSMALRSLNPLHRIIFASPFQLSMYSNFTNLRSSNLAFF